MKICSFLPSATETVCALGRAHDLAGISYKCNFPAEIRTKPIVVRGSVDLDGLPSATVNEKVSRLAAGGESPFIIDKDKLKELRPDVILTQKLCRVCAPSDAEAAEALAVVPEKTKVLYLNPTSLDDVFEDIRRVGEAIDALDDARKLIYNVRQRATQVQCLTYLRKKKPRVMVLEWLEPLFSAGHWIPEMVEVAGGIPVGASEAGEKSRPMDWKQVADAAPDVIILAPCGMGTDRAARDAAVLKNCPPDVPALKNGKIFAVDADSYITRPGPRIADGIELLGHILYPELEIWQGEESAFRRIS